MAGKDIGKEAVELYAKYLDFLSEKLKSGKTFSDVEFEQLRVMRSPEIPAKQKPAADDTDGIGVPERLRFKRSYTLTEKALEARRKNSQKSTGPKSAKGKQICSMNSWKHGLYARNYIMHKVKPCKSSCPQYPCSLVQDSATQPGGQCLDKSAVIQFFSSICEAVEKKQYGEVNQLFALTIANQIHILHTLMEDIQRDGTMLKKEKHDKDGNYLGYEVVPHPSLLSLVKLSDSLNITPNEMMATPKALSKQEEDEEGMKTLADLMSSIGRGMNKERMK